MSNSHKVLERNIFPPLGTLKAYNPKYLSFFFIIIGNPLYTWTLKKLFEKFTLYDHNKYFWNLKF